MESKYDSALLGILQHEGKIEKFLNVIFGFLMRRTDFYHIMTEDQKKLGFPPGVNLRMVLQAFERHKNIFEQYERERQESSTTNTATENTESNGRKPVHDARKMTSSSRESETKKNVPTISHSDATQPESSVGEDDDTPLVYQAPLESYNGAVRDNYSWSQTIKDVDIRVQIPPHVQTARELIVKVERKRIQICIQRNDGQAEPYFDRILCWEVLKDEVVWTFNPKENQIHFSLDKVQERWWDAAFEGEDKINTRKIDCSRPMHELDEEAQAKIQQLMYDEQQKRKGLPTSEQQKIQDMLAKAWNQEDSPFRGTQFDPSKINISPSQLG